MSSIQHVAIIMDGNGRWAERRGLPRWKGHEMGAQSVRRISEAACRQGIPVLTLFAFSSENWKRPSEEIRILFNLLHRYLISERQNLLQNEIRVSAFGRRDRIPRIVREALAAVEAETRDCRRLHLRIALDYGSRYEIIEAVRALARDVARRKLPPEQITEEEFVKQLSTDGTPDPDLIIRTAGEQRLSNFLLWQAAYAEFYFTPKLWPDFDADDLAEAVADFHARTRKFGALACASGA
ncbi:MAG: polyprenyl diphosphate synthase [Acidobacteriota bacterium]|nr:polyprenyl diphosphate synthase [Acidobacteriota bacterium]